MDKKEPAEEKLLARIEANTRRMSQQLNIVAGLILAIFVMEIIIKH